MDLFEAAEEKKRLNPAPPEPLTVSQLTELVKRSIEDKFAAVWVVGQISNLTRAASGHVYFTLKDEGSEIGSVIWRGAAQRVPFKLENGLEIIVHGRMTVYEKRGCYQIVVTSVQPKGMGALQLAFLQLRDKLAREGLFDPLHKRPIPFLPERIGIVTSPTGAAIHDILMMIERRLPQVKVLVYPVAVQGEGAAQQIAQAIRDLNEWDAVDVMIVGRGGGSIEDLWPFNEEVVARAIFDSSIPVISAVGHEIDVSISDLVADVRALTPTQAGEMVVPSRQMLDEKLELSGARLGRALIATVQHARARVESAGRSYGMRSLPERIKLLQQRIDEYYERVRCIPSREIPARREALEHRRSAIENLNPRNVLSRGYSITLLADGSAPLHSAGDAKQGDRLKTILHEGEIISAVE